MQRSAREQTGAVRAIGDRASILGPTYIDRIIERVQSNAPTLTRLSDRGLVAGASLLAFADLVLWRSDHVVDTGRLSFSIAFLVPLLGILGTVAVPLRNSHLRATLQLLVGVSGLVSAVGWFVGTSLPPSFAMLFVLTILTAIAVRTAPSNSAITLTMIAAIAIAFETLRPAVGAAAYLLVLGEGAFGVAVAIGVYLRWSDWRRVALAATARNDEQLEIARELHDMLGHYVTGIVVQAQAAQHVAVRHPAETAVALQRIEVAGNEAMRALRRMVGSLRESPTEPLVTWDSIEALVADAVAGGEPVNLTIDDDIRNDPLSAALAPSAHRIIAESLTNVRRHAIDVTRIDAAVCLDRDQLVLWVRDNGRSLEAAAHEGFGIIGMRERATSLGGTFSAGPASDAGWTVLAELPMKHRR